MQLSIMFSSILLSFFFCFMHPLAHIPCLFLIQQHFLFPLFETWRPKELDCCPNEHACTSTRGFNNSIWKSLHIWFIHGVNLPLFFDIVRVCLLIHFFPLLRLCKLLDLSDYNLFPLFFSLYGDDLSCLSLVVYLSTLETRWK